MSELIGIKNQFQELQKQYQAHLPKVDPDLLDDLLLRQMENPRVTPMYMVEVFTKPGLNTQEVREYIIRKTGMSPAIYDNGTHYVTNQKLTLEMLKEISDSEDMIEVTGEYTGGLGSYGASHEHGLHENRRQAQLTVLETRQSPEPEVWPLSDVSADAGSRTERRKTGGSSSNSNYRIAIYIAAGIAAAIAIAGFIISGGLPPNSNVGQAVSAGAEPAVLHGYVGGPGGLPAVGATVVAAQQGTNFVASSFVSINGQYLLDVPAGEYVIVVAYPDGTDKVANLNVERGSDHELNFDY